MHSVGLPSPSVLEVIQVVLQLGKGHGTSTNSLSGTTTYSYDGNGNQTGSVGPSGVVTDT